MALATYSDLTTALANWLNRDDLTDRIPEFIALAEADIRRRQEWWERTYSVDDNGGTALAITVQGQQLDNHVREVLTVWGTPTGFEKPLDFVTAEGWRTLAATNADATGTPSKVYISYDLTRTGGPRLYLWPQPAQSYSIDFRYVKDLDPLSSSVNGLYTRNPDLYLYGSLLHSAPFLKNDDRLAIWEDRYEKAVNAISREVRRTKYATTLKAVQFPRVFG